MKFLATLKLNGLSEIMTQNELLTIGMSAVVDVYKTISKSARYGLQLSLCAVFTKLKEAYAISSGESKTDLLTTCRNCVFKSFVSILVVSDPFF